MNRPGFPGDSFNDDPTFQTPPSRVNNLSRSLYRQAALNNKRLRSDKILEIL